MEKGGRIKIKWHLTLEDKLNKDKPCRFQNTTQISKSIAISQLNCFFYSIIKETNIYGMSKWEETISPDILVKLKQQYIIEKPRRQKNENRPTGQH